VIGFVGFSAMGRLELRYLEAFTPAIAAAFGAGVAMLAGTKSRGRSVVFAGALALTGVYALYLARGDRGLQLLILAAALGAATLAAARSLWRAALPIAAASLALVALLAVPTSDSLAIVRDHMYDSSAGGGFLSARQTSTLSAYLATHQGGARYEAAVLTVWEASSLVVADGRPMLVTRNVDGAPMMSVADLRDEVQRGEVRYVVAGAPCMGRTPVASHCPPAARWAQLHGKLVPRVVPRLGLYRVSRSAG
jgi:hypothetical protein